MDFIRSIPHPTTHKVFRRNLRILILIECVLAFILMAMTIALSTKFAPVGFTSVPGKVIYDILISVVTFVALLISLPLDYTGWCNRQKAKVWDSPWPRILLNLLFVVLWIGATVSAFLTCNDLCAASPPGQLISWVGNCCNCARGGNQDAVCSDNGVSDPNYVERITGLTPAVQGLTIVLMITFAVSVFLSASLFWHVDLFSRPGARQMHRYQQPQEQQYLAQGQAPPYQPQQHGNKPISLDESTFANRETQRGDAYAYRYTREESTYANRDAAGETIGDSTFANRDTLDS